MGIILVERGLLYCSKCGDRKVLCHSGKMPTLICKRCDKPRKEDIVWDCQVLSY